MVIQWVVPAAVETQVLSWVVSAQLGAIQVASPLENVVVMRPVAIQVTAPVKTQVVKEMTPQATHMWIQVPVQVGTQVNHGHCFLPLQAPIVCEVVWILPDWPALFGGLVDYIQGTHCQGRVLFGSKPLPGGKSLSWREN